MDKNKKTALALAAIVVAMVGLCAISVPLYRLFCERTGYAGTIQRGGAAPQKISERTITILFDARTDNGLPWEFKPEQVKMTVKVGQQGLASFVASNLSAFSTTGTALYNVTPDAAGQYFHKTQCFCFAQQILEPGKTAHFPVIFYLDPKLLKDPDMDDVTDITLSYTFFSADSKNLDTAIEKYGQKR